MLPLLGVGRRATVDFESFYADRVMDATDEAGLLLVLSFDPAGIAIRDRHLGSSRTRAFFQSN